MPALSADGARAISTWFNAEVAKRDHPAMFAGVATADKMLYFNAKGEKVFGQPEKGEVDADTILQLWSMTKLVTSVACLQLVERGLIDVDSPALIEEHLPELASQPILTGMDGSTPQTKPRTRPLTLRHLLTHTSGLGYVFTSPLLEKWLHATKQKNWLAKGATLETTTQPLLFEPGTRFMYGFGIDWAGILVERLTGKTLEDYFRANIWARVPGGAKSISFYPTRRARARLMGMHGRKDGKVVPFKGWRDLPNWEPGDVKVRFGGGGLIGTAQDYIAFLQHLLGCYQGRDGGVLSPQSAKKLFEDAFPAREDGNTCHEDLAAMMRESANPAHPMPSGKDVGHSLGMALTMKDSPHGRRAGSANWGGVARTKYWIDPTTGIVGFIGTQILEDDGNPFARVLDAYERTVYDALDVQAKL